MNYKRYFVFYTNENAPEKWTLTNDYEKLARELEKKGYDHIFISDWEQKVDSFWYSLHGKTEYNLFWGIPMLLIPYTKARLSSENNGRKVKCDHTPLPVFNFMNDDEAMEYENSEDEQIEAERFYDEIYEDHYIEESKIQ